MKSIGSRITVWYAVTATTTLACLFVAGHYLLENQLVHQLDALNEAQFKQLKYTLGPNYKTLTPPTIDDRIREVTESASSLFYIDMHGPMSNRFFRSNNLRGQTIPDIPGERAYAVEVNGVGELRVSEFILPPFEVTQVWRLGRDGQAKESETRARSTTSGCLSKNPRVLLIAGLGSAKRSRRRPRRPPANFPASG